MAVRPGWQVGLVAAPDGPVEYFAPPGIRIRAGQRMTLGTRPPNMLTMSYEAKVANDLIVDGEPEHLAERFDCFERELGTGHLLLQCHESKMTT